MRATSELGFNWNEHCVPSVIPTHTIEKTCFRLYRLLPDFICQVLALEDTFLSPSEVTDALYADFSSGLPTALHLRVRRLASGIKYLMAIVRTNRFSIDSATIAAIHEVIANEESPANTLTRKQAELTASKIWDYPHELDIEATGPVDTVYVNGRVSISRGLQKVQSELASPLEVAMAAFLVCELQTRRSIEAQASAMLMMNGVLLQAGIDAIIVPVARTSELTEELAQFRVSKDASKVISLLLDCHPAAREIYDANPHLPAH
jgi:hypothetical protein